MSVYILGKRKAKSMSAFFRKIEKVSVKIVWILIGLAAIWMTIASGNTSSRINLVERSYIISDSIFPQLLASALVLAVIILCSYLYSRFMNRLDNNGRDKLYKGFRNFVLIVITVLGLIFVLAYQKGPRSDQLAVVSFANAFRNNDFTGLIPEAYMGIYHNQFGIILALYFLSYVFGNFNYIAIQVLNVFALSITYWAISVMIESKFGKKTAVLFLTVSLLFFPALLYLTFVYGTIFGIMLCALGALCYERFIDYGKWRYLWLAGLLSLLAIIVKQNYLIFVIGLFLWALLEVIDKPKFKTVLSLFVIAIVLWGSSVLPNVIIEKMSSEQVRGGVSSWSFIAMGLQENEGLYDGWWNNYNVDVYNSVNQNTEELTRISKEYIKDRFREFADNPMECISFFSRKNVSQWMNPDFEGFWINWAMPNANPDMQRAGWVDCLNSIHGAERAYPFLNVLQFIVYLGTVLYVFFGKKNNISLYFAVIFLGGVIFHTFWEAKSQYTLPYFIYLLPVAAMGWSEVSEKRISLKSKDTLSKHNIVKIAATFICLVLLVMIQSKKVDFFNRLFAFDRFEDEAYNEFYRSHTSLDIDERKFNITNVALGSTISVNGDALCVITENSDNDYFEIITRGDWVSLRYSGTNRRLDVAGAVAEEGRPVNLYHANDSMAQRWRIIDAGDGAVYILYRGDEDYTLTADSVSGSLYLDKRVNADIQKWILNSL